jgi:hypothetical protein
MELIPTLLLQREGLTKFYDLLLTSCQVVYQIVLLTTILSLFNLPAEQVLWQAGSEI